MQIIRSIILALGFIVAGGVAVVGQDLETYKDCDFQVVEDIEKAIKWIRLRQQLNATSGTQENVYDLFDQKYGKGAALALITNEYEGFLAKSGCKGDFNPTVPYVGLKKSELPFVELRSLCTDHQPENTKPNARVNVSDRFILVYEDDICYVYNYTR